MTSKQQPRMSTYDIKLYQMNRSQTERVKQKIVPTGTNTNNSINWHGTSSADNLWPGLYKNRHLRVLSEAEKVKHTCPLPYRGAGFRAGSKAPSSVHVWRQARQIISTKTSSPTNAQRKERRRQWSNGRFEVLASQEVCSSPRFTSGVDGRALSW